MNVSYDFTGQVAVVTGAARGVGRAMVGSFVATGANVVAADRDETGLAETCAPFGDKVLAVTADVSTPDGAAIIVNSATRQFGRLSFCVNNAAVAPHTSLMEETAAVWDTVYAVNCRGTFLMTQRAGQVMIDQGQGGRIVNFSSGVSSRGPARSGPAPPGPAAGSGTRPGARRRSGGPRGPRWRTLPAPGDSGSGTRTRTVGCAPTGARP
jgi:NAD(P)-dependent dehydrogenase (short-subunit alcohol dehydrogenase family)